MAARGRRAGGAGAPPTTTKAPTSEALNTPFKGLPRRLAERPKPPPPPPPKPVAPPPPPDADLFASAMNGVVPLAGDARVAGPSPGNTGRHPVSEEAEALAALSDLVTGVAHFDVTDTREYIEGIVVGLDPRVVRRLRHGDFSWQAYLDLHGMVATEAHAAVDRFLHEAFRNGLRCVLLVHGRGHNSKDHTPVLKERLKTWLAHGRLARIVLAFTTARPVDGGAGALYVLLRRQRRSRPIQVTEGAKR